MSQLAKAISAVDTDERILIRKKLSPLFNDLVNVRHDSMIDPMIGMKYRIGVKIETSAVIHDPRDTELVVNRVRQQIVEAVFGEFRQDIARLSLALNDYDVESARAILDDLSNKMFGVE